MLDPTSAAAVRFRSKIGRHGADDCWPWQAAKLPSGYGRFKLDGRMHQAHRLAYELSTGVAPGDLSVCHRCDNPPCCNPAHLFLGSGSDNMADCSAKRRLRQQTTPDHLPRPPWTKLDEAKVREIRAAHAAGKAGQKRLAATYGVSRRTIRDILAGKWWKAV